MYFLFFYEMDNIFVRRHRSAKRTVALYDHVARVRVQNIEIGGFVIVFSFFSPILNCFDPTQFRGTPCTTRTASKNQTSKLRNAFIQHYCTPLRVTWQICGTHILNKSRTEFLEGKIKNTRITRYDFRRRNRFHGFI